MERTDGAKMRCCCGAMAELETSKLFWIKCPSCELEVHAPDSPRLFVRWAKAKTATLESLKRIEL